MTEAPPRSLWLDEALAGEDPLPSQRLEGHHRADVCIVGGGFTGLWTALRLKELRPSLDVALVEADICGGGASGRNGGFVLSWWAKFHTLRKLAGTEDALWLARSSADAVADIGRFCLENDVEAGYHHDGWLWAASNRAQIGSWDPTIDELEAAGAHPYERWSNEEVAIRSGSDRHLAGVFEPSGATVQPAMLARGMARVAARLGVRLFEGSPMRKLSRGPGGPVVETRGGRVAADRVVLAMNAWAIGFAEIRRRILVIGSDVVATDPAPNRLRDIGWTDGMSISDSRLLVHYYRTTDDGRIAFGKGGGALAFGPWVGRRFEGASPRAAATEAAFRRMYPMLGDVPVSRSWTGPIDRSRSGLPLFGSLRRHPDVVYGVGYSGNGVGPSVLGGRILASLALGLDDRWARCPLVARPRKGFPPEPIRLVGGAMVRAAVSRAERAEDEDRTPNPIDTRLIRLAPAGLVPMHEDR